MEGGQAVVLRDQFVVHFGSRVGSAASSTETAGQALNTRGRSRHLQLSLLSLHMLSCICAPLLLYQMFVSKANSHFEILLLGDKILSLRLTAQSSRSNNCYYYRHLELLG